MSKIMAVETGRAGALRIEVPKMNISIEDAFEKTDPAVIKGCFDTIQELSDFAGMLADGKTVAEGKIAASL